MLESEARTTPETTLEWRRPPQCIDHVGKKFAREGAIADIGYGSKELNLRKAET